jgi:hydroxymethylpyrimidine pyrophosphatase-like HAD family hydrolase
MTDSRHPGPWLISLDIDGTTLRPDGTISADVIAQIRRLDAAGHHIVLTTGRSEATTIPVLRQLAITPMFAVCSNGAVTLRRDPTAPDGYRRTRVHSFDPEPVLRAIYRELPHARFAVEDRAGVYRCTQPFPPGTTGLGNEEVVVPLDRLLHEPAVRVVATTPDHDIVGFLSAVERIGLRGVTYAVGWTAWLDIAAEDVNKATAIELVRRSLRIPRDRVMAVGDGHNDIELVQWAARHGRGVAMGHAPEQLLAAASELTATVLDDGLAHTLSTLPSAR